MWNSFTSENANMGTADKSLISCEVDDKLLRMKLSPWVELLDFTLYHSKIRSDIKLPSKCRPCCKTAFSHPFSPNSRLNDALSQPPIGISF
jgi:hypothetical protein